MTQTKKLFVVATSRANVKSTTGVWTFRSDCAGSTGLQFMVVGITAAGKILFGPHHQRPHAPLVIPAPVTVPAPCQCARLGLGTPVFYQSAAVSRAPGTKHPLSTFTVEIPYTLSCSGGPGECSAQIEAKPPPGWYGTDWRAVVPRILPNGSSVDAPGPSVGGIEADGAIGLNDLLVTCNGSCNGQGSFTTGKFFLTSRTNKIIQGDTVIFGLEITCSSVVTTKAITLRYKADGSLIRSGIAIAGAPPPPPPTLNVPGCQCDEVTLGSGGVPVLADTEGLGIIKAAINWRLICSSSSGSESEQPCSATVKLDSAPDGVVATLTGSGRASGRGLSVTCAGSCQAVSSGYSETTGGFLLNATRASQFSVGDRLLFRFSAVCPDGETTHFLLRLRVLRNQRLAYSVDVT
jgi:hypothetical protein